MKNKILSLVLALLMAASSASAVLADGDVAIDETAEEVAVVEEVEAGQYDKAIAFLANYGIFKGYDKNNTGAEDPIERYQMALFVARIATGWTEDEVWEDGPENWSEFSDIDFAPVNNYYGALSFANQKGIIEGYGNGKFGPQDHITYQNALTMVVRTLGYTGLDWPWGYIQKAVELGLTDGITGVAYTDELTRGEVAQIVYNALFAKMKDGSNLALKNFGIEFGWEKVVITASNLNTFTKLATDKGTGVGEKFVEFKLLNDDGSLADDTYTALASKFELDVDKHEDDLAVGKAYYVLFEKDADSELANIVAIEDLYVDTKVNAGKTDDEEEDQAYEIKEFFDEYTLVDKYTNFLSVTASLKDEVLVWDKTANIVVMEDAGHFIAIDWTTGDILVPQEIKDNKVVDKDEDGKTDYDWDDWKVEWYRADYTDHSDNERYYKVKKDADGKIIYGIDWMSEKEFEDTYAKTLYKTENKYNGFAALTSYSNTAYAALDLFDTNLDGIADRGLYESYALGYFETVTEGVKCGDCNKKYDSWKITKVGTEEKAAGASRGSEVFNLIPEGTCSHAISNAWFVEGYEPTVDEDGEYVDGYVIYGYDAETKAIKIVKDIEDGSDADSYVATGVLRAYKTSTETITIGEDKLDMNYDELAGTGFYKVNDSNANKNKYDSILKAYFNQFVKYVVVDGELVHIELAGAPSKEELIVVDGYKGISADGYIVVNGYSTIDLEYAEFRLGSIDGWKKGDAFYNAEKYEDAFVRGVVYDVVSYDKDEDAYFVEVITDQTKSGEWLVEGYEANFSIITTGDNDIEAYDNYLTKKTWNWDEDEWNEGSYIKMSSSDKWVFVTRNHRDEPYAVITVYEGKLPVDAEIKGDFIKVADNSYVVVNAEFNSAMYAVLDRYSAGVVVLYKDTFDYADYNGEYAEDDRYILGGVDYTARVFNLLNGEDNVTVGAFNDDFDLGYAYLTEGGILTTANKGVKYASDIVRMINNTFSADTYVAEYIPNILEADGDYIVIGEDKKGDDVRFDALYNTKDDAHKKAVEAMILEDIGEIDGSSKYLNNIDGVTYRVIEIDEVGTRFTDTVIADINDSVKGDDKGAKAFKKFVDDGKYTDLAAFYVYDVEGRDIVIYLVLNEVENGVLIEDTVKAEGVTRYYEDEDDREPIVVKEDVGHGVDIIASEIAYTANVVNDTITEAAIKSVNVKFAGEYIDGTETEEAACKEHDDNFKLHFGAKGAVTYTKETCIDGDANVTFKVRYTDVKGNKVEKVGTATVTEAAYYDSTCNLVKELKIALDELVYIPAGCGADFNIYINGATAGWYANNDDNGEGQDQFRMDVFVAENLPITETDWEENAVIVYGDLN